MLTLNDGRSELWQWDTGRKLTVDADCSQVHFSNKVFGRSVDMPVINGVVEIPDFLLQTDKDLTALSFVGTPENGYTKISKTFKVNKRNKPADYVFTPPDQTTLAELLERLDAIEENQDPDAIKNAVDEYLRHNPVDFPVDSVNGKIGKVQLTADDVGAISQDKLQEATNAALAQAKESGAFDDVLYVHVNKTYDGTLTTQATSEQIYNAYKNNKVVICRYSDMDGIYLLPLFVCSNKDTVIFNALVGSQRAAFLISGDSVQDLSDSLSFVTDEELETAVNDALAEAKASGAFDGAKGEKGDTGAQGEPGKDGAQGPKGDKGDPGKDGQPGADGKDGADGKPGADGQDGYTPVKGVDYFTEADKKEIAEQVSKEWKLEEEIVADGSVKKYVRDMSHYGYTDVSAVLMEMIVPQTDATITAYCRIFFTPLVGDGNPTEIYSWDKCDNTKRTRTSMMFDKEAGFGAYLPTAPTTSAVYGQPFRGVPVISKSINKVYFEIADDATIPSGTIMRVYTRGGVTNA